MPRKYAATAWTESVATSLATEIGEGGGGTDATAQSMAASAATQASTADSKAASVSLISSSANSRALSSGLAASVADSKATSDSVVASTADSKGVSSGLRASVADSKGVSAASADGPDSVARSSATSAATLASANHSVAESRNASQSLNVSVADSKGASAALAGGTDSIARSQATSVATTTSSNASAADSKNVSQSSNVSTADSKAVSAASQGGGSDPWTVVRVNADSDFTTSSATAVDVTGLSFTPLANTRYMFEAVLAVRSATATVNPRPGLAWATGMADGIATIEQSSTATAKVMVNGNIAAPLLLAVGGIPNNTQSWPALVYGWVRAGASPSGTIRVQLASETAGTVVRIVAGSYLRYRTY